MWKESTKCDNCKEIKDTTKVHSLIGSTNVCDDCVFQNAKFKEK